MSNAVPLPPIVERADEHYHGEGLADAVHAHAAAVSAERDARIKVLEDQLAVAAMQLINAIGYMEEARAALGDKTPNAKLNGAP